MKILIVIIFGPTYRIHTMYFFLLFFCLRLFSSLSFSLTFEAVKVFSKRLTRTDVANRLSVKSRALQHLPGFADDQPALLLTVEDEEGKKWVFRYRIRHGKYKRPEFSTGWLDFVRSKKLKTGDKIQFCKEEEEDAIGVIRYKIKVKMEVRLFGAVIGYVPYHQPDP